MTIQDEILAAEDRVREAKRELRKLRQRLSDAPGWPRIARGRGPWSGEIFLILGVYDRGWGSPHFITRRIYDDGALGTQAHGCSVGDNPSYLTPDLSNGVAVRHKNRRWAKNFLSVPSV